MHIPSFVFVEALRYLPWDCLFTCMLAGRGLRMLVRECTALRCATIAQVRVLPEQMSSVRWLVEALQRHFSSLSMSEARVELPGMELDSAPPIDVVWGNLFPSLPDLPVRWSFRSQVAIGNRRLAGCALVGAGTCGPFTLLSVGVVDYAAMCGPQSICASLLFSADGKLRDVYWVASVGHNQVHLLRQPKVVTEAIMSSDPMCFGNLFEQRETACDDQTKAQALSSFAPYCFSLLVERSPNEKMKNLLSFCDAACHSELPSFGRFVEDQFLNRVLSGIKKMTQIRVFAVREEIQQLTTPKGVWACSTGNGFKTAVNLEESWSHRSTTYLAQISRGSTRGVLFEGIRASWFPCGILRNIALGE